MKVLTLLAPVQDQTQQRCDTGHKILNGLGNGCITGISPNGAVGWRVHVLALGKPKGLLSPSPFNGYLDLFGIPNSQTRPPHREIPLEGPSQQSC